MIDCPGWNCTNIKYGMLLSMKLLKIGEEGTNWPNKR